MSRLINLRSPYFIKATPSEGKTLESAQLDLYVWKGDIGDIPTTPTYTLQKSVTADNNYAVFEIAELCRDKIEYSLNGNNRKSEPVFINAELTKNHDDDTVNVDSFIVWGLDGWGTHSEGIQASQNLLEDPDDFASVTSSGQIKISIKSDIEGDASTQRVATSSAITFTATYNPSGATLQWKLDGEDISGATSSTYAISSVASSDFGKYECVATSNSISKTSNAITLEAASSGCNIQFNPWHGSAGNRLTFGNAKDSEQDVTILATSSCPTITASHFELPDWLDVEVGDGATEGVYTKYEYTLSTKRTNNTGNVIDDTYYVKPNTSTSFTRFVRQLSYPAVHKITVADASIDQEGQSDVSFTVTGDIGAEYKLYIDPGHPNNSYNPNNEVVYGDEIINATDLTGTISDSDGDTYTFTVPENNDVGAKTFFIRAKNVKYPNNLASSPKITQANSNPFVKIVDSSGNDISSLTQFDTDGESKDFYIECNAPVRLQISKGDPNFYFYVAADEDVDLAEFKGTTQYLNQNGQAMIGDNRIKVTLKADNNRKDSVVECLVEAFIIGDTVVDDTLSTSQAANDTVLKWTDVNGSDITSITAEKDAGVRGSFDYDTCIANAYQYQGIDNVTFQTLLNVCNANRNLPLEDSYNTLVRVEANDWWEITADSDGFDNLEVEPKQGYGSQNVALRWITSNPNDSVRSEVLTLSPAGSDNADAADDTLTVNQKANSAVSVGKPTNLSATHSATFLLGQDQTITFAGTDPSAGANEDLVWYYQYEFRGTEAQGGVGAYYEVLDDDDASSNVLTLNVGWVSTVTVSYYAVSLTSNLKSDTKTTTYTILSTGTSNTDNLAVEPTKIDFTSNGGASEPIHVYSNGIPLTSLDTFTVEVLQGPWTLWSNGPTSKTKGTYSDGSLPFKLWAPPKTDAGYIAWSEAVKITSAENTGTAYLSVGQSGAVNSVTSSNNTSSSVGGGGGGGGLSDYTDVEIPPIGNQATIDDIADQLQALREALNDVSSQETEEDPILQNLQNSNTNTSIGGFGDIPAIEGVFPSSDNVVDNSEEAVKPEETTTPSNADENAGYNVSYTPEVIKNKPQTPDPFDPNPFNYKNYF